MWCVNCTQLSTYLARHGCSTALYKSQEGSRVSTVSRNSQRSQDTAMSTLFLSAVYRQTRRICKKKVRNDDQMFTLSGLLSDPWRRHVWQPSYIFSSQPIGRSPRSEKNDGEEAQRCSSCEENNTATCYCFVCQTFLCKDCFDAHQRLKATRGHRNALIDNLQAQDVEELMHRPAMCAKKYHENEPLDYYCQDCSVCICHRCSIVSHNRNTLVDLQEGCRRTKDANDASLCQS